MNKHLFSTILFVAGLTTGVFLTQAWATKPYVSNNDMSHRAAIVLTGKVISNFQLKKAYLDKKGVWQQETRRIGIEVDEVLKPVAKERIEFDTKGLSFDKGKSYVFFLNTNPERLASASAPVRLKYLDTPAKRVEATPVMVKKIKARVKSTRW